MVELELRQLLAEAALHTLAAGVVVRKVPLVKQRVVVVLEVVVMPQTATVLVPQVLPIPAEAVVAAVKIRMAAMEALAALALSSSRLTNKDLWKQNSTECTALT
jgi:hypothetical protein